MRRVGVCALFDEGYLVKGMLMLRSLLRHASFSYEVAVLTLDAPTTRVMRAASLLSEHPITVVPLEQLIVARPELALIRQERAHREFCWTLGSVFTQWWAAERATTEMVFYADADLFFFDSLEVCALEMQGKSVGIVPHRFSPGMQRLAETSGVYNVSVVGVRRDECGLTCLQHWAEDCMEQCDASTCGDQRYLDVWPTRYEGRLHVFRSPGIGVGPWNVMQYDVSVGDDGAPFVDGFRAVFYHYHEFAMTADGDVTLSNYALGAQEREAFYGAYTEQYRELHAEVAKCK